MNRDTYVFILDHLSPEYPLAGVQSCADSSWHVRFEPSKQGDPDLDIFCYESSRLSMSKPGDFVEVPLTVDVQIFKDIASQYVPSTTYHHGYFNKQTLLDLLLFFPMTMLMIYSDYPCFEIYNPDCNGYNYSGMAWPE